MVRRSTDKSIEEAIELGKKNQQKHRYLNWCKHLHINLLYPSEVGRMTRLPIGPHEVYCDYFTGSQSVNVELIASHFIKEHCADCPFHDEVHPENPGRAIVEKVRERRSRLSPALQARQKLQELAQVANPIAVLEQDVVSDRQLLALLALLEDGEHKQQAADKALTVAQELDARLFSPDAVRVTTTYFADPDIGERAVQIAGALCTRHLDFFDVIIAPAKYAFMDGHYREALAYLLGDYVAAAAKTSEVAELVPVLIAHHTMMLGVGIHKPSKGAIHALQAVADIDVEPVAQVVEARLADGDKHSRLQACDTLGFLIEDHPELAQRFFETLLDSLYCEEDRYDRSADRATIALLARIVIQDLPERLPVVERFYEAAPPKVKALIFRLYEALAEQIDDEVVQNQCASKAIHTLAAGIDHIGTLDGCAEFLERLARKRPDVLLDKLDNLIGALALLVDQPAEIRQAAAHDSLEWLNRTGLAAKWERVVAGVRKAIEEVGKSKSEAAAPVLRQTIANTSSKTAERFKGHLISILGKLSRESLSVTQDSIPLLFGLLVDNDSPIVRGNAAEAFGEMAMYRGDVLPRDVLDLLKELLWHETNVYVLQSLIRAFRHIHISDLELATSVCNALAAWEQSFDSPQEKKDIMDALLRVASRFEELRQAVKPWLWRYCHHEEDWIRQEKLEEWYHWSQRYPEYTFSDFVKAALQFYRDFKADTRDFNGLERPYEHLLRLPRHHFAEHLMAITEVSKSQDADRIWNKRDFATLLSIKEYYHQSAQLYLDLVESLPAEPRFDNSRRYFRLLAYKDSAEAAVLDRDFDRALDWLEKAVNLTDEETDDLARIQVPLRQRLLCLLSGFDLANLNAFATEIEAVQQQYAQLFEEHYLEIHETDDDFFRSLDNLLETLGYLCNWAQASLHAEDNPTRYIEAARNQLDLAIDFASRSDSALYAERLEQLSPNLEALNRVREITSFIQRVALVPIPLIFEYRVKDNWGGAKFRQRVLRDRGIDIDEESPRAEEPEDVNVAQVRMSVDGRSPAEEIALSAGVAYGFRIEVSFARWPEKYTELQLRFLSTSPAASRLPLLALSRPAQFEGDILVDSHLVFEHPLSPAAPPIEAKLVASLIATDGREHVLDLFGDHRISLRVLERPQPVSQQISISNSQGIAIGNHAQVTQHFSEADQNG